MAIKMLAAGDIHIGRQSTGLKANEERISTKKTWETIVDWAIKKEINLVALTGDIVDEDNKFFEAHLPLQKGFSRLNEYGIKVLLIAGNHDYDVLPEIIQGNDHENVFLLGKNGTWETKVIDVDGKSIQFTGWSFPDKHVSEDPLIQIDSTSFDKNKITIGLLHGDIDNPESQYAPIDHKKFDNIPVDAWILGHIHKPHQFKDINTLIYYTGSPHALNPNEQGMHGPLEITVKSKIDISVERAPLSPVRYEFVDIDVSEVTKQDLRNKVINEIVKDANSKIDELHHTSYLVYDVTITGSHIQSNNILKYLGDIKTEESIHELKTGTIVSVRKIENKTLPAVQDLSETAQQKTPLGKLAETVLAIENNETTQFLEQLIEKWKSTYNDIKNAPSFRPLSKNQDFSDDINNELAKTYILNECKRMMAEFLAQNNE